MGKTRDLKKIRDTKGAHKSDLNHSIGQFFLVFVSLGSFSYFFPQMWSVPGSSLRSMCNFLLKMDSTTETTGGIRDLPPFSTSKEPFWTWGVRKFPWPQEWSSSLYSSRAQLLQLALSLECGENKASVFLHLTDTSCPAQGPLYLAPLSPTSDMQLGMKVCVLLTAYLPPILSLTQWPLFNPVASILLNILHLPCKMVLKSL